MKNTKQWLIIEQLDQKLTKLKPLGESVLPNEGWINTIRNAMKMSLRQLSQKIGITPQSLRDIEQREKQKTVSLKTLQELANALDMQLVYALIPKNESIEQIIERRAAQVAQQIVLRTTHTMRLEDQENSKKRLEKALCDKTNELKLTLPRYLWD
jgi:predicted DNA-binding mobile mystery protein A